MINLNTPLNIKRHLTLRNRVVVPPMASATADKLGCVSSATIDHYSRLTSSGAGLVMVEYTFVHDQGRSEPNQLGIQSDDHIDGLTRLANKIRFIGAASGIQITHAGAKSDRISTGGALISPSGIPVPIRDGQLQMPDIASESDIETIKRSFLDAAVRAERAGFDILELHSAHGYGLNQWLSPITNQRKDQYGGSVENRARLLIETLDLIKKRLPDSVLSVRIPGMDHYPGGLTHQDMIHVVHKLEVAGVDLINVSSGIGGWRRPQERAGEGYLVSDASIIQSHTSLPVIGVGGIHSAEYINKSLEQKLFSLAAVGRAILTNPSWGSSVELN